jgi:hypothetical protein
MPAQRHDIAKSMEATRRYGLSAVFFTVRARCSWLLFAAAACQKARVSAGKVSWLYFCGIYSDISDALGSRRNAGCVKR